ncbi:hypothetical protein Q4485_16885 [Granulosicoccaceae sp. 1_MG-2023]|nr:hypothetical protein [Granulosicoccaceae sp. 1_MG-2023]
MIDLHCHILPGIDDGASDLPTALMMLRLAATNGITHMVATPHIHPGRFDNDIRTIGDAYRLLKEGAKEQGINVKLGMAAEVRIDPIAISMLSDERIPFIGERDGEKILLVEMPHSHIPAGTDKFLTRLLDLGIRPLIAHPERNKEAMRNPERLTPLIEMGCLMQVTASSVSGSFGHQAYMVAAGLLEQGAVEILASDAHNTRHRPPELFPGMESAADIIGREEALKLVLDNPMRLAWSQFSKTPVDIFL